jgi:hypothetical protein
MRSLGAEAPASRAVTEIPEATLRVMGAHLENVEI